MNNLILYYSFTGNNTKLARAISDKLNADCIELKEIRKRSNLSIFLDVVFNRIPKIQNTESQLDDFDHVIFVAPIWFGKIGTPLRDVFRKLKDKNKSVSLVTLSAGFNGVNSNTGKEIVKRTGITPKAIINPLIIDLLPAKPKPTRKALEEYKISEAEAEMIAGKIIGELEK